MTPKNPNPSKPPSVESWWEANADYGDVEKYFHWKFYTDAEDRSLARMHEMHLRDRVTVRTVMNMKLRLHKAGAFVRLSSREHFLAAADFRGWAETDTDPKKKAELISLGNLAEGLGRAAVKKKVAAEEARKARNAKRAARREARKLAAKAPRKPRRRS
jgi:hypothetical protein